MAILPERGAHVPASDTIGKERIMKGILGKVSSLSHGAAVGTGDARMESDVRGYAPGRTARRESGAGGASSGSAGRRRRRKGFTLVEVIVVLVILAILAAIAIPALTGYIDKAQDKQYMAQAREAVVAMRSIIAEDYAAGTIVPRSPLTSDYLETGVVLSSNKQIKCFNYMNLGLNTMDYWAKATIGLMGGNNDGNLYRDKIKGFWTIHYFAPNESSYTIFNAPMWMYCYFPEGYNIANYYYGAETKPMIVVLYKIKGARLGTSPSGTSGVLVFDDATYDPNGGYEVLHLTTRELAESSMS
jgi:prepilin-type N-terminal cleavage/methylation domain-containing protein